MADDDKKPNKVGMYLGTGSVLFAVTLISFFFNYEKREHEKYERFKADIQLQYAIDERLKDLERVVSEIVKQNIFHRLDDAERRSVANSEWNDSWEDSGELPVDREQNRRISENRTELDIVHQGLNAICYGLRDREPTSTVDRWPPCDKISRVR